MRYRVAHLLDLLPGWCWASLVTWAQYEGTLQDLRNARMSTSGCHRDVAPDRACYCAKLCTPEFAREHLVPAESRWPRSWRRRLDMKRVPR